VDGLLGSSDDSETWRRLVSGCEGQPLLISELLAFHDRRVADPAMDTAANSTREDGDNDLDHVRSPEGSLYVELYATHNRNNPTASPDLYAYDPTSRQWYLDLSRIAPQGHDGVNGDTVYPVWRLAISEPHPGAV